MFSDKKQKSTMETTTKQNIIAQGTKILGDIESKGPFRIDGSIEGNVSTEGKVVIGKAGEVKGTLNAVNVDVEGKFAGKLVIKGTLSLKSTAQIDGEVQVNKLVVEPGATFNATCSMGAVKALNNGKKTSRKTDKGTERTA
ncbi:MAG: polymer-forming cytoskeletal protein [Winogradskyella sp.]|uniref:bactofilin family protein n=1 Tax=Winogradskyella sp. TaxID=1883156 RepID=UPI0017C12DCA|nr:polymer-forming cytoskeletal protein [Winogradskyella sp.]MBT8245487.1 polymer-forming cytoskeletal protein [Winogradskyella sp.]NNK22294.1 polymer-forming cytoskeletal protein [Winogradskyella sp.]